MLISLEKSFKYNKFNRFVSHLRGGNWNKNLVFRIRNSEYFILQIFLLTITFRV